VFVALIIMLTPQCI